MARECLGHHRNGRRLIGWVHQRREVVSEDLFPLQARFLQEAWVHRYEQAVQIAGTDGVRRRFLESHVHRFGPFAGSRLGALLCEVVQTRDGARDLAQFKQRR